MSKVGGLYNSLFLIIIILTTYFGQPLRELNLALAYQEINEMDGELACEELDMSKRFRQKITTDFKFKYFFYRRCNILAKLLCCRTKNLNEFKLAMEYYDQVLRQAKYVMSIRRMTGI